MERVMAKATKKAFSKTLAALLAVLMVISPFSEALGELGWFSAWTSGDNGNDTVHNNTAYSNGEYSVLYDKIIVVGSGFNKSISAKLAADLGIDATKVVYYGENVTNATNASGAGSLVVYACGTSEVANATEYAAPDAFKTTLSKEVDAFKAKGADVLLVTPGPIVEYGAGMYYATHSGWTAQEIASGNNVTNLLRRYVEAISEVATEKNIGIVSLYGKAKLFGEEEYMAGTKDGIYPSDAGNTLMTRWIAEYIAENYVLSSEVVKSVTASKGKEVVIDLGSVQSDIDAVTITIPSGQKVPSTISVQTTKVANDQWFEAVADVKTENYTGGIYSASLMFDASYARFVRISADGSDIPAGTTIKVHKTKLLSPVLTYPVAGQSVTTKQAFNIEWSAVAGADRFEVTILKNGEEVKKFTTSDDVQTIPKGIFSNGVDYNVTVKAIRSGYANSDAHSGTGSTGVFNASDNAKLALSSEPIYEDVSEGKLITIGNPENVIARDGEALLSSGLSGVNVFKGGYTSGLWLKHHAFSAVAPLGSAVPVELIVDLNKDANGKAISSGDHLVTGVDIGFAIDSDAFCPSSIVVSVQKDKESAWTKVGGKVYMTNGTSNAASYLNEIIPLTNADASDVKAARVKITLYTNISNLNYPANIASGAWGKWLALSHIVVNGGQYAGTIQPDGATAAYHANYLQNTKLVDKDKFGDVGRDNFGNVNNTEIWNTISWKSAQYTTANSGYLESTGNITIGKVYWASQNVEASASNKTNAQTPSAINPNVGGAEIKATKVNISSVSVDSSNAMDHGNNTADISVLYNGNKGTTSDAFGDTAAINAQTYKGQGSGVGTLKITLASSLYISKLHLYVYEVLNGYGNFVIKTSKDNSTWTTADIQVTSGTKVTGTGSYASVGYKGEVIISLSENLEAKYILLQYQGTAWGHGLTEIEVYDGAAPVAEKNWASADNGGQYKGYGDLWVEDTSGWTTYHSGKLNDGTKIYSGSAAYPNCVGFAGTGAENTIVFKLSNKVDVSEVKVYAAPREGTKYFTNVSVYVGEAEDISSTTNFGSTSAKQTYDGSTMVYTLTGSGAGNYVFIEVVNEGYIGYVLEIEINGTKADIPDTPDKPDEPDEPDEPDVPDIPDVPPFTNTQMTDGEIYDGRGQIEDYTFDFVNDNEDYDYMIIDLGAIYYSLTDFDVSMYQVGNALPSYITFEVSSKLYVPNIANGAAFSPEDWQYVSVVTSEDFKVGSNGRYTIADSARLVQMIDGAFGRYIKVTFWYSSACGGVDVEEIMVTGSDDYVRANVADGKDAKGDKPAPVLTDGAETNTVSAKEFTVDLGEVKAGIHSFELVGATGNATLYISAGGTSANDFHKVETINGNGTFKLSDKVSARYVQVTFDANQTVSEFRVFADAGRENYYTTTGYSATIKLVSDTIIELDNVVSIGKAVTVTGGTVTNGSGANGTGIGSNLTDGKDLGFANGVMLAGNGNNKLWYALYSSTNNGTNFINVRVITDWAPTLDSTNITAKIGTQTYKFEFNGDVNKGFITSNGAAPYSYSAERADNSWTVDFTVRYQDVSSANTLSNVAYKITAFEGTTTKVATNDLTFNANGNTNGWNYASANSTWTTITPNGEGKVVVQMDLGKTYYGLNDFAITTLEANGYKAPENILFQVSNDNVNWKNVGFTQKSADNKNYYPQYQDGKSYAYNFNIQLEGVAARYVRAVLKSSGGASIAIQEFWVNAQTEPSKASGGDSAVAGFDYKMLWDDKNLYIAFQYEEDEVPFYTANHQYHETFTMVYNSKYYTTNGQASAATNEAGASKPNAFSISNLGYDPNTGYFQLDHEITRLGDLGTEPDGNYYEGYSTKRNNTFKLYKVGTINWNKETSVTNGRFTYGNATETTEIKTTTITKGTDTNGKTTIASGSTLNGYVLVSNGYALSQTIGGYSLTAKPITVEGNIVPADQITDDLVWYFEDTASVSSTYMSDVAKQLGDYNVFSFYRDAENERLYDRYHFDNEEGMAYYPYYLIRAYQGMVWENVYTYTRCAETPNIRVENTDGGNGYTPSDTNWNFDYNSSTGMWSIYLRGQGTLSYGKMYDNIDGASSMRIFLSAANMNDTARYDYGNYDIVIDAYVLDNNELILEDGTVIPLDSTNSTLKSKYYHANHKDDYNTGWDGYKAVELKATALGMTPESNEYFVDFSKYTARAKFAQSENGQRLLTVEIAIPFEQLGFCIQKDASNKVTKWGNFYTKTGIERPIGKRTLMQFDYDFTYTKDHNKEEKENIDEFYYYVDASEFGYILQFAPEGKGYQDISYNKGEGYSTFSSVRGEVLNTTNGTEIKYDPKTFDIEKISTTREGSFQDIIAELKERDSFKYVEEDGMYYFTSQLDHERTFNQVGTISTEIEIPVGGAYFSFDWKVSSETSDNLSFWLEQTDTWNAYYKNWINTYNCGLPYKLYSSPTSGSQKEWTGVLDYSDTSLYSLYSEVLGTKGTSSWKVNEVPLKNDACIATISGNKDITRDPEYYMLTGNKEIKRSYLKGSVIVNIDDVISFTPITDEENGMFKHVWDWHNVTVWIPNTTNNAISYTFTWMYYKNGTALDSYTATDGRGTDDAQITNFHLATTDELGYWKNTKNWDTLRLDATIADPSDTMLGVKDLAKAIVAAGEAIPAISATANDPNNAETNTFGDADFFTLSYAAIAAKDEVGNTTKTTNYFPTKNKISVSASNVPAKYIESYINNAIVFTQEYNDVITASSNLVDWTVLELKYNPSYNTWELTRMFEEGVDKSKFNIYADNNTIILAVNYTYLKKPIQEYGKTTEAIFFGYQNREVLKMLTPAYRYAMNEAGTKIVEEKAAAKDVTQLITSNIFIRENYNIARGKMYSLRNNPTYSDGNYPYMENWFVENKGTASLTDFLAAHSETPLYYVNKNGEIANTDRTSGDYREAFKYYYRSYADYMANLGLHSRPMMFDTNQYGNVLYVPAGVGQLTDGKKMSVYSDTYLIQKLEDYAIGYYVSGTMGTPDADTVEAVNPADSVYSYTQEIDLKHDKYEVFQDVHTREENIILDLGTVEYGLSAFNIRFLGGGEDGVTFPTSVEFAISSDGLSYAYIGSVALDDTSFDAKVFDDEYAHASIVFSGATDTVYGNTVADYMFDLQTVGVTARYIKATIMNHSAQNAKTFITEFQVIQNAIYPDKLPASTPSTWIDASSDANLMYIENLEMWDNAYKKPYSFALAPTTAGYLFAEDEGYPDIHSEVGVYKAGELTDGVGGSMLYKVASGEEKTVPTIDEIKKQSVGWMKAYAPEVSLTFDLGEDKNIGFVSVYALHSKDSVDKIKQPFNVTAYVSDAADGEWLKVATVNAKDNDASEVTLKGMDVVIDVEGQNGEGAYTVYKYTLAFARDGELAQQVANKRYVKIVAETDGGEDGWICLTEVEVFEGHPCYPVYDLTESKYEKKALDAADDQDGDVRPTFFRGYYDSDLYSGELPPYTVGAESGKYDAKLVFNNEKAENYTIGYVFGNVEQRAVDGRGVPYFYKGDQLLLRVTTDNLNCDSYNYNGDWVSNYKLLADSRIYYTSFGKDESGNVRPYTTRLFTTTAVTTPMTVTDVLARDRFTCKVPANYNGEDSYYYLPIYLMNSLDYLKDYGYLNNKNSQNYINMPENKVELSGDLIWDTNYEADDGIYADDKNGISLNLAPLGAKTNTGEVKYNDIVREPNTTLRFGSIWYIDDTAYYNTHTHMQQYGTLLMTIGNLGKYFTDSFAATSKYTSVFDDYGVKLTKSGTKYVSDADDEYTNVIELANGTYWGAKDTATLEMLKAVFTIVGKDTTDDTKVMAALDVFLEYINVHGKGELVQNENYEDFGGIAMHSRANKYYYFSNISTTLVPEKYDDKYDSTPDKQNQTDLLGVYNYDQRYLEFDAIIAGIPESQKGNKIVAVPYIIYANNYEFLEFGEHLGEGDEYVEKTWHDVFNKYYSNGNDARNTRFYFYGGGIARSINDVLASAYKAEQYD